MRSSEFPYHAVIIRKDGTSYTYDGDVPPYEESWTDIPVLHLFWSWNHTITKILKEVWYSR